MTRPPTFVLALAVPVVAVIAVIGTRFVEGPSSSSVAAKAGANAIVIKNFAFAPKTLTATAGTKLEVTNADGTVHTLTAKDKSFDTGDLDGGKRATVVLKQPGTYEYFCEIHNYMTGTLVVK
jgi:plastocyanin